MQLSFKPKVLYHPLQSPASLSTDPSVMAFSLAKAGSTLLYDILMTLAPKAGMTFFSAEDALFQQNVGPHQRIGNIGSVFSPTGFCYGGFRQFPAYPVPILHQCRTIFLVRDPRDMAVSLYFSLLKSHVVPEGDENSGARDSMEKARSTLSSVSVSEWAIRAATIQYTRMFEGYIAQGFHWRPNVAVFRYEDVIFEKEAWIRDICEWFQWDISIHEQRDVAARFDILPDEERPDQHIRQVAPGNHRKHLTPGAIKEIESTLGDYLRMFDYAIS